jgi:hypothetical protein
MRGSPKLLAGDRQEFQLKALPPSLFADIRAITSCTCESKRFVTLRNDPIPPTNSSICYKLNQLSRYTCGDSTGFPVSTISYLIG